MFGAAIAQLPDDLLSRNTLKNIEKNKERTDYCVTTFKYISNRYLLSRDFCPTGVVSVFAWVLGFSMVQSSLVQ